LWNVLTCNRRSIASNYNKTSSYYYYYYYYYYYCKCEEILFNLAFNSRIAASTMSTGGRAPVVSTLNINLSKRGFTATSSDCPNCCAFFGAFFTKSAPVRIFDVNPTGSTVISINFGRTTFYKLPLPFVA